MFGLQSLDLFTFHLKANLANYLNVTVDATVTLAGKLDVEATGKATVEAEVKDTVKTHSKLKHCGCQILSSLSV